MQSFRACALVLGACVSLLAREAAAQQFAPRLAPLPAVSTDGVLVARNPGLAAEPSGSYYADSDPHAGYDPHGVATGQSELIDGTQGPTQFQQGVQSGCPTCGVTDSYAGYDGDYGYGATCGYGPTCGCGSHWFAAIGGVIMGRNRANAYTTTLDAAGSPVLNTQSAGVDWTGGWEINAGYLAGDGCETGPGFLFTYWGLAPMKGFAQVDDPTDSLSSTITTDPFFQNSASQRIWRDDLAENYELSLLIGAYSRNRWTLVPYAGFRYFRFDERLIFGGLAGGGDWSDPNDTAFIRFRNVNNLYGGQFGALINYNLGGRFGWYLTPKVGLYGNQMVGRYRNYLGDGTVNYNVVAHKSDFALLGEVNTGFNYFLRQNVFFYAGYRIVGVTGVALGDNQLQTDLANPGGLLDIRQGGSLILHGAMIGAGWMF